MLSDQAAALYVDACEAAGREPLPSVLAALDAGMPEVDVRGMSGARRVSDADCGALAEALACGRVEALHAGANPRLTDAGVEALLTPDACESLTMLDLSNCAITSSGAAALAAAALRSAPSLQELVLDGNELGEAGGAVLAGLLRSHGALASLRVARCGLGMDALIAIAAALPSSPSLRVLDVSDAHLFSRNEETSAHFARALRATPALARLAMRRHTHMSDTSTEWLADALLDCPSLRELDLSGNALGPPSGVSLAKAMTDGAGLTVLQLSHCKLGDGGAVALGDALARGSCPTLRHLDLRSNGIGDKGLQALSTALASELCALETLLLWGNPGLRPGCPGAASLDAILPARAVVDVRTYAVDGVIMCAQAAADADS